MDLQQKPKPSSHEGLVNKIFFAMKLNSVMLGGVVASWLEHFSPDQVVQVPALARDTALRSWARHLTLKLPLST